MEHEPQPPDDEPAGLVAANAEAAESDEEPLDFTAPGADLHAPLAGLGGIAPPAPEWFDAALAAAPEVSFVEVDGAAIETLVWGQRGNPGLLLLHGNGAHARWWSHLAPFLATDHRVAAMSWSGMGGSQWRERYSLDTFVAEMMAVIDAAGLAEGGARPIVVAHSFGGFVTMACAARHGERLRGAVIVDTPLWPPHRRRVREAMRRARGRRGPTRVYPTLEEALVRFRLLPPQPVEPLYIVDHIARHSLREVPRPALAQGTSDRADAGGWTWRFDPLMWQQYAPGDPDRDFTSARCPLAYVYGERSALMNDEVLAHLRSLARPGMPLLGVPDAQHHLLIDQPIAFVSMLRGLFACWPPGG